MTQAKIIYEKVRGIYPEIREIRRHLHQYPELSFKEYETSAYIRKKLDEYHIDYIDGVVDTGIIAMIGNDLGGKTVGLRADMDALPVEEQTGLPFASKNSGVMHACGHDVHSSILLGVAKILKEMEHQLKGRFLLVFQPGEELVPGGASQILEGKYLPQTPDVMIAQHVAPELLAGQFGFRPGLYMASTDEVYIRLKGRGGHAALPERLNDPVVAACQLLTALQQVVSRKAPPQIPTVLSFGKFIADGATNVIPDEVSIEGTFRTFNEEWREKAMHIIYEMCSQIPNSMGVCCEMERRKGFPYLENHPESVKSAKTLAQEMFGMDSVIDLDVRMTGEDFAFFSHAYPSVFYRLGTGSPGEKEMAQVHTGKFSVNEESLIHGMNFMSNLALHFMHQ